MPIYEYQCQSCGETCERVQKISEAPLARCPYCDAEQMKRLVSAPAFQLKGSGWYVTDFKNPPKKEAETPTAPPPKTTSDKKTDES